MKFSSRSEETFESSSGSRNSTESWRKFDKAGRDTLWCPGYFLFRIPLNSLPTRTLSRRPRVLTSLNCLRFESFGTIAVTRVFISQFSPLFTARLRRLRVGRRGVNQPKYPRYMFICVRANSVYICLNVSVAGYDIAHFISSHYSRYYVQYFSGHFRHFSLRVCVICSTLLYL